MQNKEEIKSFPEHDKGHCQQSSRILLMNLVKEKTN